MLTTQITTRSRRNLAGGAQHPVESNRQFPRRCHLRHSFRLPVAAMQIFRTHAGIAAHRNLRRFHQQHPHEAVPLLADRAVPPVFARAVFPRNQSQVARYLATFLSDPREPFRKICKCRRVRDRRQQNMHCYKKSERHDEGQPDLALSPLEEQKRSKYYFHCD